MCTSVECITDTDHKIGKGQTYKRSKHTVEQKSYVSKAHASPLQRARHEPSVLRGTRE